MARQSAQSIWWWTQGLGETFLSNVNTIECIQYGTICLPNSFDKSCDADATTRVKILEYYLLIDTIGYTWLAALNIIDCLWPARTPLPPLLLFTLISVIGLPFMMRPKIYYWRLYGIIVLLNFSKICDS